MARRRACAEDDRAADATAADAHLERRAARAPGGRAAARRERAGARSRARATTGRVNRPLVRALAEHGLLGRGSPGRRGLAPDVVARWSCA